MRRKREPNICPKCGKACFIIGQSYHEHCIEASDWDPITYKEFKMKLTKLEAETRERLNKSVRIIMKGGKEVCQKSTS